MPRRSFKVSAWAFVIVGLVTAHVSGAPSREKDDWASHMRFRVLLNVDLLGRPCSGSPASVEIDFQKLLQEHGVQGTFDKYTVQVVAISGLPRRVPHRVDRYFGATFVTLHFVVPDPASTNFAVYFDTVESRHGKLKRHPGLVGDGDRFSEQYKRREIAPSHFDSLVDFDGDGDLDLFKGGVEPFVYCWENIGGSRLVERGRLTTGGKLFSLPCSTANRSWVTVAFHDIDNDGDQDFIPSFGDGPDAGKIVFYRNTTRGRGGQLTFQRVGPLETTSGVPLAGNAQAGGWFPSIALVENWDGDGRGPDALVGSNHRCWLYRHAGVDTNGSPRFAEADALEAAGKVIELINPRFDCADIDADGDLDLFAGTQPGAVHWFENIGTRSQPAFASGKVVAWNGKYLIGDVHSGVKVADVDNDGLLDVFSGRFWERTDLNRPDDPIDFGGLWKNVGTRTVPRFKRRARGALFTEQFQACDAIRQNCVRAVDWDSDGQPDLLAGDTDGFIWFFRNRGSRLEPVFDAGEKLQAGRQLLSVAATGGHARFDVCDWNSDGGKDLVVADGSGTVTLFLDTRRKSIKSRPLLDSGRRISADGRPIQLGARASVLVCDWDNDGRNDLVLADDKGYYFSRNISTDAAPLLAAPQPVTFGGKPVSYVRPNLGSFVDWDGDGKRDLIGCHFENSIRFYRNVGSGARGEPPRFADPEGTVILRGESPQMISGADAVDWNGDGDLDLLTGQGHGASGLRFYERDWIENTLRGRHPMVKVLKSEMRP